jgi:hypothetical protein
MTACVHLFPAIVYSSTDAARRARLEAWRRFMRGLVTLISVVEARFKLRNPAAAVTAFGDMALL